MAIHWKCCLISGHSDHLCTCLVIYVYSYQESFAHLYDAWAFYHRNQLEVDTE